jgi:hypothetical protein
VGPKLETKIDPGNDPRAKKTMIIEANLSPIK